MEDGGVDTTVTESRQHKMGQMADFPPLLASSGFDFKNIIPVCSFMSFQKKKDSMLVYSSLTIH